MRAVLLDFNGTMFFDTSLNIEAWSKIYQDLYPEDTEPLDMGRAFGANNAGVMPILVRAIDNHNIWLKLRHVAELPFIFAARKRRM